MNGGAMGRMGGGIAGALVGTVLGAAAAAAALAAPAPRPASSLVTALAGRYSHHFTDGLVDGTFYPADDVAEVVPVDATHAYVRFALNFYNGHTCSLAGVAAARGDALVYTEPADAAIGGEPRCTLTVRRGGGTLAWDDRYSCKSHCGERGSFSDGGLPWASRRAIGYLPRLKASRQYRDALTEWRTGHAVQP